MCHPVVLPPPDSLGSYHSEGGSNGFHVVWTPGLVVTSQPGPCPIKSSSQAPHALTHATRVRAALSLYGKEHALTDSILQEARTNAKAQLFGVAEENVKFAEEMKSELEKEGHVVELVYTSRKETLKNVERLVVGEELIRLKNDTNGTLDREERRQYWNQWKTDNYALLINSLTDKGSGPNKKLPPVGFLL